MRKGGRIFILLGVTLALVAAVLAIFAFQDTSDDEDVAEPEEQMVEVIEATRDIPVNHIITEDDIEMAEVEESTVSPGTARSSGQVLGLAASGDIVSGQRVLMGNLVTPGLSHVVGDGMRAVALPIDRVNALGGMIRADDRIDVIYSIPLSISDLADPLREQLIEQLQDSGQAEGEPEGEGDVPPEQQQALTLEELSQIPLPGEPGSLFTIMTSDEAEPVTKLLLQNIRVVRVVAGDMTIDEENQVVAAEQTSEDSEEEEEGDEETPPDSQDGDRLPSADMLIVEVDPAAAELLKFILDYEGQFQVALRGPDDTEEVETPGMTFRQMIEDLGFPVPRPAEIPEDGGEE